MISTWYQHEHLRCMSGKVLYGHRRLHPLCTLPYVVIEVSKSFKIKYTSICLTNSWSYVILEVETLDFGEIFSIFPLFFEIEIDFL